MEKLPLTSVDTGRKEPVTKFGRIKPSRHDVLVAAYKDADYWLRKANWLLGNSFEAQQVEDIFFEFLDAELETVISNYHPTDESKATFTTYFIRALRYHCLKHSTAKARAGATAATVDRLEQNLLDAPDGVTLADRRLSAADQLERSEQVADCNRILKELPKNYRAAVILVDGGGLSYEDTATRLAATAAQVRSWVHRGRAKLPFLQAWLKSNTLTALTIRNWPAVARQVVRSESEPAVSVPQRIWALASDEFRLHTRQLARVDGSIDAIPPAAFIAELNGILAREEFRIGLSASERIRTEFNKIAKMPSRGPIATTRLNRLLFNDYFAVYFRQERDHDRRNVRN